MQIIEAQRKLKNYILLEEDMYFKEEAIKIQKTNNSTEILNRFYKDLEFGTAGIRGIIGAGTCYMNTYNVKKISQGICNYVLKINKNPKVAISYDSRYFSKEFAYNAAQIFASNNFETYVYKSLRPSPQLSYTIRKFDCDIGVMITASHNSKEYNGYKAYWKDGIQIIPPHDKLITNEIKNTKNITNTITIKEGLEKGIIKELDNEIDDEYVKTINKEFPNFEKDSEETNLKIAYTALHGTGGTIIKKLFANSKIQLFLEKSEILPNPEFPTINYPNPEKQTSMFKVIELAKKEDCDIALATDPDADRIGIAFKDQNEWIFLNGNQISCILMHYILSKEINPKNTFVISSFVTTPMLEKIARKYDSQIFRTYTGFKWIGNLINEMEKNEPNKKFAFACEESHGYLIGREVRDKDAFSAIKGICSLMLELKAKHKTIKDYLEKIYKEFGYYEEFNIEKNFKGVNGEIQREKLMLKLRKEQKVQFAGFKIIEKLDYQTLKKINFKNEISEIKEYKYPTNTIKFILENEIIIIVRPSGTEPKIKFYISVKLEYKEKHKIFGIINAIKMEINKY
ncbi:phospho-sugar mutase [Borreliella americana]|uniref:phospho-sugar mutase n=2 Tax=Borreliella americana TaxID=478807 RepID=UPI001E3CBB7B|nr:phospho-sugar mutase [Borreliella americana]MCD2332598.1 phospho-sugar mutase [Borreliella americana]MCD2349480.1 phospho-sugar mutase [Borreliella americana]